MIPFFFTGSITTMIGLWALYALAYYGIIRKMGAEKGYAIVPVAAEWRMSKVLFASMRSFYQPVLATGLFLVAAYYVGPRSFFRYIFWLAGIVVYSIYLARLNWRISKSFNMGLLFQILTVLFPFPCLLYLGFGKAQFTAPTFMIHQAPKWVRYILNATVFLISAAELGVLVFVVGLLSIRENMPRPLVEYLIKDANEEMGNITEQGPVVRREDVMDTEAVQTASAERERDYFYPDHAGDKSVVVMEYVVDMTYMATAHQKLDTLFESEKRAIAKSPENYANISIAASDAYTFNGASQIDLIDYLCILADMDYKNEIMTDAQYKELIDAIRACVVVRNANSATGVNGLAFCFPTKMISDYTPTYNQLTAMGLDAKKSMCNDYFSIMASQQAKVISNNSFLSALGIDYTKEPWYVKGFEEYDTADAFIDIPLVDTGAGYRVDLPDEVWKNIVDMQVGVYMLTEEGRMDLGHDHIGALDENGNPMVALDNSWPHIGGALIAYNADKARETEEGTIFSGKTRAMLNGNTEIEIYIECDPVKDPLEQPTDAHIIGYEYMDQPLSFMAKGMKTLEAGDTLQFLFDFYDNEGHLVKTDTYGKKVIILNDHQVAVSDAPFGECDLVFGGRLTDIYQRVFQTEMLETHVEK